MFNDGYGSNMFNRYTNLDGVEWRIIQTLVDSKSKYANNLWKMLKFPTEDCLFNTDLTTKEKYDLIYQSGGLSTARRVFMMPFVDDAWEEQAARVDIFVDGIYPINHLSSKICIGIEVVVHNKINNILGEAMEGDGRTNPSELDELGENIIPIKSRAVMMLKSILAELNGKEVAGVGQLQLNETTHPTSNVKQQVWNNKAYFGYKAVLTTLMSGVSDNPNIGN